MNHVSIAFGIRLSLSIVLLCYLVWYLLSIFNIFFLPMPRAGTEIYDVFNAAMNLNNNESWTRAFLFDQRVSPPGVPLVYEHAPNNIRIFSYLFIQLGMDNVRVNTIAIVAMQLVVMCIALFKLFSKKELLWVYIVLITLIVFDNYFLSKFLNPLRITQYIFYYYLASVLINKKYLSNNRITILVFFFAVWQTELVFAAYLTLIYTFFIIFEYKFNLYFIYRKSIKVLMISGLSIGIFICQLFIYRGASFVSDWINVVHTRNTILYEGWVNFVGKIGLERVSKFYSREVDLFTYQIPSNFIEALMHTGIMVYERYDYLNHYLPLFIIFSTLFIIFNRKNISKIQKSFYLFIFSSLISYMVILAIFRGYVSFLYLMLYEPLLDMIINFLIAINVIVLAQKFKAYKIFLILILTLTIAFALYNSSIGRWESRIKSAAPLSSLLINELSNLNYRNKIIYSNFNDNYAIPGLIHTHLIYYPAARLINNWSKPELIDYYICSNIVGSGNNCQDIIKLFDKDVTNIMYEDSSGAILKLK